MHTSPSAIADFQLMNVAALKQQWVGLTFDTTEFEVRESEVLDYALACGEIEPRYTDPSDPDFQAPTNYVARFVGHRLLPEGFPTFGTNSFDAGKCVFAHRPVRPGDQLTATSTLHDIYEKTGRSGSMVFIVHRMEFRNQAGELVSVVDWRMVIRM